MPEFICSNCGDRVRADTASALCPACQAATAIAKPEHAEQVRVTSTGSRDTAIREGEPRLSNLHPPTRDARPSFVERMYPIAIALGILILFLITFFILGVWAGLRAAHF
jgi:hypothetical protein